MEIYWQSDAEDDEVHYNNIDSFSAVDKVIEDRNSLKQHGGSKTRSLASPSLNLGSGVDPEHDDLHKDSLPNRNYSSHVHGSDFSDAYQETAGSFIQRYYPDTDRRVDHNENVASRQPHERTDSMDSSIVSESYNEEIVDTMNQDTLDNDFYHQTHDMHTSDVFFPSSADVFNHDQYDNRTTTNNGQSYPGFELNVSNSTNQFPLDLPNQNNHSSFNPDQDFAPIDMNSSGSDISSASLTESSGIESHVSDFSIPALPRQETLANHPGPNQELDLMIEEDEKSDGYVTDTESDSENDYFQNTNANNNNSSSIIPNTYEAIEASLRQSSPDISQKLHNSNKKPDEVSKFPSTKSFHSGISSYDSTHITQDYLPYSDLSQPPNRNNNHRLYSIISLSGSEKEESMVIDKPKFNKGLELSSGDEQTSICDEIAQLSSNVCKSTSIIPQVKCDFNNKNVPKKQEAEGISFQDESGPTTRSLAVNEYQKEGLFPGYRRNSESQSSSDIETERTQSGHKVKKKDIDNDYNSVSELLSMQQPTNEADQYNRNDSRNYSPDTFLTRTSGGRKDDQETDLKDGYELNGVDKKDQNFCSGSNTLNTNDSPVVDVDTVSHDAIFSEHSNEKIPQSESDTSAACVPYSKTDDSEKKSKEIEVGAKFNNGKSYISNDFDKNNAKRVGITESYNNLNSSTADSETEDDEEIHEEYNEEYIEEDNVGSDNNNKAYEEDSDEYKDEDNDNEEGDEDNEDDEDETEIISFMDGDLSLKSPSSIRNISLITSDMNKLSIIEEEVTPKLAQLFNEISPPVSGGKISRVESNEGSTGMVYDQEALLRLKHDNFELQRKVLYLEKKNSSEESESTKKNMKEQSEYCLQLIEENKALKEKIAVMGSNIFDDNDEGEETVRSQDIPQEDHPSNIQGHSTHTESFEIANNDSIIEISHREENLDRLQEVINEYENETSELKAEIETLRANYEKLSFDYENRVLDLEENISSEQVELGRYRYCQPSLQHEIKILKHERQEIIDINVSLQNEINNMKYERQKIIDVHDDEISRLDHKISELVDQSKEGFTITNQLMEMNAGLQGKIDILTSENEEKNGTISEIIHLLKVNYNPDISVNNLTEKLTEACDVVARVNDLRKEFEILFQEKEQLDEELSKTNLELRVTLKNNVELKKNIDSANSKKKEINHAKNSEQQIEQMKSNSENLIKENAKLSRIVTDLETELTKVSKESLKKEKELKSKEEELNFLRISNTKFSQNHKDNARQIEVIHELEKEDLKSSVSDFKQTIAYLQEEAQKSTNEIEKLKNDLSQISRFRKLLQESKNECESLLKDLKLKQQREKELESTHKNELKISKRNYESKLFTLENEHDKYENRITQLRRELERLSRINETLENHNEKLKHDKAMIEDSAKKIFQSLHQFEIENKELVNQKSKVEAKLGNLSLENQSMATYIKKQHGQLIHCGARMKEMDSVIVSRMKKNSKLKEALKNRDNNLASQVEDIKMLHEILLQRKKDTLVFIKFIWDQAAGLLPSNWVESNSQILRKMEVELDTPSEEDNLFIIQKTVSEGLTQVIMDLGNKIYDASKTEHLKDSELSRIVEDYERRLDTVTQQRDDARKEVEIRHHENQQKNPENKGHNGERVVKSADENLRSYTELWIQRTREIFRLHDEEQERNVKLQLELNKTKKYYYKKVEDLEQIVDDLTNWKLQNSKKAQ